MHDNGHYAVQGHSRSPTDFGTNRKPICDFLLVINTNLHTISHRFEVIALQIIGQICAFDRGVPLFDTLVRGEPLNLGPRNLVRRNYTVIQKKGATLTMAITL